MIPAHIVEQYGSARKFRSEKRTQLRSLRMALNNLHVGCAFFPSGRSHIREIEQHVNALEIELSVKQWGR